MSNFIAALFSSENVRYALSLLIAAILSYSAMWHSVNDNAYEIKSLNKEIKSNSKNIDKTSELIKEISKDITEIKILLAKIEQKQEN